MRKKEKGERGKGREKGQKGRVEGKNTHKTTRLKNAPLYY